MSRAIVWLPSAEASLQAIYDLIAADSPRAALAFTEDLRQRCEIFAEFPFLGTSHDGRMYQFTFDRRVRVNYAVTDTEVQLSQFRYLGQL